MNEFMMFLLILGGRPDIASIPDDWVELPLKHTEKQVPLCLWASPHDTVIGNDL